MNPHVQACLAQKQSKSTIVYLLWSSYVFLHNLQKQTCQNRVCVCCARSCVIVCGGAPHHTDSAMSLPRYGKGTFQTKAPGSPQSGEARIPSAFRLRISSTSTDDLQMLICSLPIQRYRQYKDTTGNSNECKQRQQTN